MRNRTSLQKLFRDGLIWSAEEPEEENPGLAAYKRPLIQAGKLLKAAGPKHCDGNNSKTTGFGITEIDSVLPEGGLAAGTLHEFSLIQTPAQQKSSADASLCPHTIPSVLAAAVIKKIVERKILSDKYSKEHFLAAKTNRLQPCFAGAKSLGAAGSSSPDLAGMQFKLPSSLCSKIHLRCPGHLPLHLIRRSSQFGLSDSETTGWIVHLVAAALAALISLSGRIRMAIAAFF